MLISSEGRRGNKKALESNELSWPPLPKGRSWLVVRKGDDKSKDFEKLTTFTGNFCFVLWTLHCVDFNASPYGACAI